MSFNFDADELTIRKLFKNYTSFEIPSFQRDYSWSALYYKNFFDDIVNSISQETQDNYFIGTMVFSNSTKENKTDVVDGQQRLTTMTILFSALSARFEDIKQIQLAKALFRYVSDADDNGEDVPRLISRSSSPFLDTYIQTFPSNRKYYPQPTSDEEELLQKAYNNFYEWLSEENINNFDKLSSLSYEEKLVTIRDQILGSKIIAITSTNKETAYRVFEILNAKGMDLTDVDLIKNYIFEKINDDPTTVNPLQKVAFESWENVKKNLRLRNQSIDFTVFYRTFWLSRYEKVTKKKLFESFKKKLQDLNDTEYINFLDMLEKDSKKYLTIVDPQLSDFENKQQYLPLVQGLKNLTILGSSQYIVLVMALLSLKEEDKISLSEFVKALNYIEAHIFMFSTLKRGQTNIYENVFSYIAIELRKSANKSETNKTLREKLYNNPKLVANISTFEEFKKEFVLLEYTKKRNLRQNNITFYVLKKISDEMDNEIHQNFSVEHILNESVGIKEVLNIGNLIGLERNNNSDAGSLEYLEKRSIYEKSHYSQVKMFLKKYKTFNESDLQIRAEKLAEYYYENILKKYLLIEQQTK